MPRDDGSDIRPQLEAAGVTKLNSPTPEDVERVLAAAIRGRVTTDTVAAFIREGALTPQLCLGALHSAATASGTVSTQTVDVIQRSIPVLETALAAAETAAEREQVIEQLLALVREARLEAKEQRTLLKQIVVSAAGVAVVTLGAVVLLASQGKSKGVLQAGGKLLRGT